MTGTTDTFLQADPVTPFENAQLMADFLGDSAVLIKQNGFGHASLAEKSSCTIGVVSRYFQEGEVSGVAPCCLSLCWGSSLCYAGSQDGREWG